MNVLRPSIKKAYEEFQTEKAANGMAFSQGRDQALISSVRKCKELTNKLSSKECLEIGKMMSYACQPKSQIDEMIARAIVLKEEMSGVNHG
jgi:hypothetical protein